jgi:hypothetical protein
VKPTKLRMDSKLHDQLRMQLVQMRERLDADHVVLAVLGRGAKGKQRAIAISDDSNPCVTLLTLARASNAQGLEVSLVDEAVAAAANKAAGLEPEDEDDDEDDAQPQGARR